MLAPNAPEARFTPPNDDILELSLMMSRRQFDALVERAAGEGMSVAQFMRHLVQNAIDEPIGVAD
jgi:hypothetical protein